MKKLVVLVAALGALATPTAAQASCHSIGCLSRQVSSLTRQLHRAEQLITHNANVFNGLSGCLLDVPITDYGDPAGTYGYVFDGPTGNQLTSALDSTGSGDVVSEWVVTDECNTTPTASVRSARVPRGHSGTPIAPMGSFPAPQPLTRH